MLLLVIFALSGCARKRQRPVYTPPPPPVSHHQVIQPSSGDPGSGGSAQTPKTIESTKPGNLPFSEEPPVKVEMKPLISQEFVDQRLAAYNKKLDKWKEYDSKSSTLNLNRQETEQMVDCFRNLQKMLAGYNRLQSQLATVQAAISVPMMSSEEIQVLQENDVVFLESFCGRLLDEEMGMPSFGRPDQDNDPSRIEEAIKTSFINREYEQVVQHWLEIPEDQLGQISTESKLIYGKSLMFLHQEQRAASVYEGIISDLGSRKKETTDVLELYKTLSNLYIAAKNYSAAAVQYRKIEEKYQEVLKVKEWSEFQQSILQSSRMGGREMGEYSAIIRNYMGYIPSQDGYKPVWQAEMFLENYPESLMITNVDQIRTELQFKADSWFKNLIGEIENLQLQEQYQDGLLLVETIPLDIIGQEQAQLVRKKRVELASAEEAVREKLQMEKMQALNSSWDQMLVLVEGGRYDQALASLQSMLDTDLSEKANHKIREVSLLAAKENRQQAAKLFIRAMKAKDLEAKKQHLLQSHELLMLITIKYPEVRIVEKVKANIRRVEQEMNKLDPTLVEWSKETVYRKVEEQKQAESMEQVENTGSENVPVAGATGMNRSEPAIPEKKPVMIPGPLSH